MKIFLFNALLLGVLLGFPNMLFSQTPVPDSLANYAAQTDTLMWEQECGGYAPQAYYHFVTDMDGIRLRQKPSLDAPVLEVMPKNKRLIWHGGDGGAEFEITFKDGTKRK